MIGEAIAFYLMAAVMLASGVAGVTSPNIVHSAVALVPAFSPTVGNTMRQMTGFNELRQSSMWWDRI